MSKGYSVLVLVALALFAVAPAIVAETPSEQSMGLVQKIFYYHVPSAMVMFVAALICGVASAVYLFKARPGADRLAAAAAELTVVFGLIVLVTGPLWARKAWGVWWQWDARLTSTLLMWMIFVACLLVRRFGGPGAEKLAAAMAVFGMANVPFVYISVNIWRTLHPTTAVIPKLPGGMRGPFWFCALSFMLLFGLLLALRTRLEESRADVERLFLQADHD
jgi:heme exporter protein C